MDYNLRYNEWLEKLTDADPLKAELLIRIFHLVQQDYVERLVQEQTA